MSLIIKIVTVKTSKFVYWLVASGDDFLPDMPVKPLASVRFSYKN